ncbi:MAG: oxidoreductase [Silicimonas sp.]|nr:oxidoreductase [Silicimonas sp.]
MSTRRLFMTILAAIWAPVTALANDGILTLSVEGEVREFDRAALEAMGTETISTTTIWTDGLQEFTGVPLVRFKEANGLDGGKMKATAINGYFIEIPLSDAVEGGPIIAYRRNGSDMTVRDKGPFWIIYPFDSNPDYQSEVIYSRSIWQLNRLEVLP